MADAPAMRPIPQPKFFAVFYQPGTNLHRGSHVDEDAQSFAVACAHHEALGWKVIDCSERGPKEQVPFTIEVMRELIAQAENIPLDEVPDGRCAVINPQTDLVETFIIACPDCDFVPKGKLFMLEDGKVGPHPVADGKRLAKPPPLARVGWKHLKGEWLARKVAVDDTGKVVGLDWMPPEQTEKNGRRFHEEDTARIGQRIERLKATRVPMGETEKF